MDKDLLIENILQYCTAKGERPTNACINAGAGRNFIINLRNGTFPSVAKVAQLAAYLGVTTSDLVGDAHSERANTELDEILNQLNDHGQRALLTYARFLLSDDENKKYTQIDLGIEA